MGLVRLYLAMYRAQRRLTLESAVSPGVWVAHSIMFRPLDQFFEALPFEVGLAVQVDEATLQVVANRKSVPSSSRPVASFSGGWGGFVVQPLGGDCGGRLRPHQLAGGTSH